MSLVRPLSRVSARTGLLSNVSRVSDCKSNAPLTSIFGSSQNSEHSGCLEDYKGKPSVNENFRLSILRNFSSRLASLNLKENYCFPCALSFRGFIHSGKPKEAATEDNSRPLDYAREFLEENGRDSFGGSQLFGRGFPGEGKPKEDATEDNSRPLDYAREFLEENGRDSFGGSQLFGRGFSGGSSIPRYNLEQNADIVHMKLLRNNTFITLTDSKGNRKPGQGVSASAGSLPDKGGKSSRFGAEATAEHVGRKTRDAGVKSIVVKVNGFTYFKKKRQAIMSFREGYTHSRGDQNPIVYIEDTTRRPHNGCRLPKKRRI